MKLRKMSILGFLLGPLLFGVSLLLLPNGLFTFEARGAMGLMLWMMTWWIFRPLHLGVTALLPVAVNAIFGFVANGFSDCFLCKTNFLFVVRY